MQITRSVKKTPPEPGSAARQTPASGKRFTRADTRSTCSDDELRQWFADDPTTELRTHLRRTLQRLIAVGLIKPGETMPSYRRLADIAGLYPSLVQLIYRELQAQGIIRAEHGRAFFAQDPLPARLALTREILARAIHECKYLGLDEAHIGGVFKEELARAKSGDVSRRKT